MCAILVVVAVVVAVASLRLVALVRLAFRLFAFLPPPCRELRAPVRSHFPVRGSRRIGARVRIIRTDLAVRGSLLIGSGGGGRGRRATATNHGRLPDRKVFRGVR